MPPLNSVVSLSVSARARLLCNVYKMFNLINSSLSTRRAASVHFVFITPAPRAPVNYPSQYNIIL